MSRFVTLSCHSHWIKKLDLKNYHDILFPYAYNILGSSEDAKDTIQDVLIKFISIEKNPIKNEIGYLIKSVINQSINLKKKNKTISTNSIWLPEPISSDTPENTINKEEILSYSMLVLLEKLSAKERAVFILKKAFEYSHKEIAETIGFTIENSRKILSRAKVKLSNNKVKNIKISKNETQKLKQYIKTMQSGDINALEKLLSEDILLAADGGKDIKVVRALTSGISNTAKLLIYVYKAFLSGLEIKITILNHQPAILFFKNENLRNCQIFEIEKNKIKNIYSIVDPSKLKSIFP